MAEYREIVTKAIVSKGKKTFTTKNKIHVDNPSTILGCWVINHNFNGTKSGNDIIITGSYDVNIWYSYDNDTKTDVISDNDTYHEVIHMRSTTEVDGEEIIVRSLKQPNCVKADIVDNDIVYVIEKELGIELVGDIKVKIEANLEEEPWDEIVEENKDIETLGDTIEEQVHEDYIDEDKAI